MTKVTFHGAAGVRSELAQLRTEVAKNAKMISGILQPRVGSRPLK